MYITVCSADGVSIRQNNGRHGGQDVFHVHFHVVPRFAGDAFAGLDRALGVVELPLEERLAQARALSEALAAGTADLAVTGIVHAHLAPDVARYRALRGESEPLGTPVLPDRLHDLRRQPGQLPKRRF